jgi:hypothetical protein
LILCFDFNLEDSFSNTAMDYRVNGWNVQPRTRTVSNKTKRKHEQRGARLALQEMRLKRELKSEAYQETIDALRIDFDAALLTFMDQLILDSNTQSHSHLANLAYRLDFNHFISSRR